MMKKLIAFLLMILMIALPACGETKAPVSTAKETPRPVQTEAPETEAPATEAEKPPFDISFGSDEIKDSFVSPDGSGKTIFEYSCTFPVAEIPGYEDTEAAINAMFSSLEEDFYLGRNTGSGYSKQSMEEMATDAVSVYGDAFEPFYMHRNAKVLYANENIISFSVSDDLYQGPESRLTGMYYQVYDIEEMKILRFTDLGDDLLEEVAAWYSVGDDVMRVIDADNDWYLDGEGIVITGFDIPVTLPYIEVEGAIKDRYLPY